MNEELQEARDQAAEEYADKLDPDNELSNFDGLDLVCTYHAGFDLCHSLMSAKLAEMDRKSKLESLIAGHIEAMRPLLDEWSKLNG